MTSEHAFQAMKSLDPRVQREIRLKDSPGKAAFLGRRINLRPDWNNTVTGSDLALLPSVLVKDEIMFEVVLAKFQQNPGPRNILIGTGNAMLIEEAVSDPYWGEGCSKNGLNKLGQILMRVREQLRG